MKHQKQSVNGYVVFKHIDSISKALQKNHMIVPNIPMSDTMTEQPLSSLSTGSSGRHIRVDRVVHTKSKKLKD